MDRRVAQGRSQPPFADPSAPSPFVAIAVGLGLVAIALFVYTISHPFRYYDHFEWQALAFLEGNAAIRFPVEGAGGSPGNAFFQDVLPVPTTDGVPRGLIPFPPLPALLLVPFVALWGHATDGQLIFAILGALDVGLAWWVLGRLPIRAWVRVAATIFFAFGTVFWYAAQIGTTWYQAHVLAVGLALAAIGVAIGRDRGAARDEDATRETDAAREQEIPDVGVDAEGTAPTGPRSIGLDGRQFIAGLLFGLACTSRLTMIFAAPFFVLVGSGATWQRRGLSAALGAGIPIGLLVLYNVVTTGHVINPGYEYLYRLEAGFYLPLNYNLDWAIEDPRYLPQNFGIMFLSTPVWEPTVVPSALGTGGPLCSGPDVIRGLFIRDCPWVLPRDTGMSILLTSPAYVLGLPALRWGYGHSRLVTGAALAVVAIAFVNLMHFSQGWVQFGYRFSNDFVPWALLLVALGLERIARRGRPGRRRWRSWSTVAVGLIVVSVAVNLWGVVWADVLGW
ncbi:MAG TPA: hypothetical protein VFY18_01540 [Candidatus Limnocylindrales bacterium]|nr:hypothetical protein [Candidatus Limnocylindrales bacterium]